MKEGWRFLRNGLVRRLVGIFARANGWWLPYVSR